MRNLRPFSELKEELMRDPKFKKEWNKLEPQYQLEHEMIKARIASNLSQVELAKRMKTTQTVISRIESGSVSPSINTVNRIAMAFGKKLQIKFVAQE